MTQLSEHFSREEFACKCGCDFDTVDIKLIPLAEHIRILNGNKPLIVLSGARCLTHNEAVGGSKLSQHLKAKAGDFAVDDPVRVYEGLLRRFHGRYGFGLYKTYIHADVRAIAARWR